MRKIYLFASVVGAVLPYIFFIQFFSQYGLNLSLLGRQMFGTPIAAAFSIDVIIASVVFWFFVFTEGRRLGMPRLWLYVLLNLVVGLSLALPLFLYVREGKITVK